MAGFESAARPEFHAGFMFLIGIASEFKQAAEARRANNPQALLRALENISLMFAGYYEKDGEKQAETETFRLKGELDKIIKKYEDTETLEIPPALSRDLYKLENSLRNVWKASGLQMALKEAANDEDFF